MTTYAIIGGVFVILGLCIWLLVHNAKNQGRDAQRADDATKGLDNAAKATAAASDPDSLKRVHDRFKRP